MTAIPLSRSPVGPRSASAAADPVARHQLQWMQAEINDMGGRLDKIDQVQSGIIDILESRGSRLTRLESHAARIQRERKAMNERAHG